MRPLIIISNDDGYEAKGINCLIDMVRPLGDVIVCAPDGGRSGMGCAFSPTIPLTLTLQREEAEGLKVEGEGLKEETGSLQVWSCNGTPVDCVKMALAELCGDRRPALVLGGINHGDNSGVNTHYSGTMGVVMEGCMKYIPSVAFSLCDYRADADFEPMTPYVRRITEHVLRNGLPRGVCLNVNFPLLAGAGGKEHGASDYSGVRVCRMAFGTWYNEVSKFQHPRGFDYWWLVGNYRNDEPDAEDTDNWALQHGYVAITPTRMDVTAYEVMEELNSQISILNSQI